MLLTATTALAHVNDRGMDYERYGDRYGQSCCGVLDCRPADDFIETMVDGEPVVRLLLDGRWITVPRSYVVSELATDAGAHFCGELHILGTNPAEVEPEPMCIILPSRDA